MSDDESAKRDYDVGYKKPPNETRFRKGHKGAPRGKARARKYFSATLQELMEQNTVVLENGKRRTMTNQEYFAKRLFALAAKGNARAIERMLRLIEKIEANAPPEKRRRNLDEIIFDFKSDMHEEKYQMLCDKLGREPRPDESTEDIERLLKEKE